MRSATAAVAALLAATALLAACGEPRSPLEIPDRAAGQRVLDLGGVLDARALEAELAELEAQGWDVVALTFTAEEANLGMAHRAGNELVGRWDADVALVAVARPGDFDSADDARQRFFGVASPDVRGVPRSVRERITEEIAPPLAAANDWQGVFHQAAVVLGDHLEPRQ